MVIISGQIEGISSRKDRTWRVTFGTQELDRETAASLTDMANQHVHALIKADMITDVEAMAMDDISPDLAPSKSHSQRLRAVLYRLWEVEPENYKTFAEFYAHRMELLIEKIKERL
jgi:hypothetical protein